MRAIAMKCTQKDWEDIKPILLKHDIKFLAISDFFFYDYLVTNADDKLGRVTNFGEMRKDSLGRTVYYKWDKKVFLDALDIKDEFILPERWYIEITEENKPILEQWMGCNLYDHRGYISNDLFGANKREGKYHYYEPSSPMFTEITTEQFKEHILNKKQMSNRFPFLLKKDDALKIIDVACESWKVKLAREWSIDIVLNKQIVITENRYQEMRSACTKEQHQLFDEIFGKDDLVDLSILNDTDIFYMTSKAGNNYLFKGNPFTKGCTGWSYRTGRPINIDFPLCSEDDIKSLRKATASEIEFYNKMWVVSPYKNGELVWVKNVTSWVLRYTTGVIKNDYLQCYMNQAKSGAVEFWKFHKPATGIVLPD